MKKRILLGALLICFGVLICGMVNVFAKTYEGYGYEVYNEEVTITGIEKSVSGNIVIPSTIEGYPVRIIKDYAFFASDISGIKIPDTVKSISGAAFGECLYLTRIDVDENNPYYTSVDGILFNKDKTVIVRYPERKNADTYVIPNSVTEIGNNAFRGCHPHLKTVVIPDSVTSIGNEAFSYSYLLTSVKMPNSVTRIGDKAFYSCGNLDLKIPNSVNFIGEEAFHSCGITDATIPDSVTSIGAGTFFGCRELKNVIIPYSVTNIGKDAFGGCIKLEAIKIPDSVVNIGEFAFSCTGITDVKIPYLVKNIGRCTFLSCENLKSVTIPVGVNSIGEGAFANCKSLKNVYYAGTKEQWSKILIDSNGNEPLENAKIHFNTKTDIKVILNSMELAFDQPPVLDNGRTLVPLRTIFEALGASVDWDNDNQIVTSEKNDVKISLQIGSNKMYVNGEEKILDVPAKLVNSRTLVPVRAISEAFGCDVEWDNDTWSVIITKL